MNKFSRIFFEILNSNRNTKRLLVVLFVFAVFFFSNINHAEAATRTWTGSTSGLWSVAGNWGGTVPVTGDDLVFPGGASNLSNTNDLTENTVFNSITFSGSGYTISGNQIIIGAGLAGITDSVSSGGNTIALDIRLDATRDIVVTNTAESLTISGRISGAGGVNKEGAGTLILSGGNTFGGTLKINVGVVNARHSNALGTILAGTEIVGGAALELQGDISIGYEALALRGRGVSSSGALRNVSGSNFFGGAITLSSAGGTEISSDSGTLTITGGTSGNFPLIFDGAGNIAFAKAPIAGSGSITKNGAGTVTYNFPNTNTGTLTINAGTILYGVNNAILSGAITITGGTLDIATFSDMVGTVTLGTLDLASGTITGTTGVLSSATWTVYNGTISAIIAGDSGALTKSTSGTVILTKANQYTGATTISAGILEIQDSDSLGTIDGITTVSAGATLQINGSGLSVPEYITLNGTGHLYTGAIRNKTGNNTITGLLTLGAASMIMSDTSTTLTVDTKGLSAVTFGLTIGGLGNTTFTSTAPIYGTSATLTKNDSGTLTIQSFSNITGATVLNRGTVVLSSLGAIPLSTTMTINAGATLTLDNTSSSAVVDRIADSLALTMNGGNFNLIGSSSASIDETAGVLTSGIATQSGNNVITITPGSGGSTTMQFASLTRTAGSSLLFRGTSFGTNPAANVSTLLFTTAPTLTGGGGLENSTTISIIAGAFGDNSLSGTGTDMVTYGRGNSNGLRLLNGAGFSGEYASNFATTNANVKLTTSTDALSSSINSIILSGGGVIADAGTSQTITLVSGNILNLTNDATIAGANTTIAGGSVELNLLDVGNVTISSLVTTTGGFTKSGDGTTTFSTAKTYTGLTSINQGTLLLGVNDVISSGNLTINGGTLDIATYSDTVGAVILQYGTITGSSGVLTGTSYSFREGTVSAIIAGSTVVVTRIATNTAVDSVVTVTRDNTYTGATTITSGILRLGGAGGATNTPLGTTGGSTTIASGGALDLNGFTLGTAEDITSLNGTGFGASGSSNMGAIMNSSATSVSYSGNLTLASAARINADYGAVTISGNASGNFALTFGGFSDITYSGVRSGTSTIVKDGIGVLTLSNGSSSYSGATTISAGTVKIGAVSVGGTNSPLGTTGGATTVALGSRLDLNGFSLGIAEPLTLNGVGYGLGDFASGALMNSSGSTVTFTGLITLGSASTIKADYGDMNLTASGTISGAGLGLTLGGSGSGTLASVIGTTTGGVTKIDTGTWTLSGQSTYTGSTSVNLGTLKLGASGGATNTPFGTTSGSTSVMTGAVIDFAGYTLGTAETFTLNGRGISDGGALTNSGGATSFAGPIVQATDSRISNTGSGLLTLTGGVTGTFTLYLGGTANITFSSGVLAMSSGSLVKQGSNTVTVTGAHTYTGTTRIDAGTFAYGATTSLGGTNFTIAGGIFDMGGNTDTIGTVTLVGGTIQNGTLTAANSYTLESGTISAVLAGAIAVTKNTNNTVTLTGANTISSTTTINAGTVVLSGSGSAVSTTITINLGGTLTLDNSTTAVSSRLGDALALTLNGGNFNFIGNSSGTSSETTGALSLSSGHNTVTVTPGAGGSTVMTFASLSRTAGATVLFRGTSLGSTSGANVSTLVFTAAPTLTGAGGASNSTTVSIIKGAFGDTSLSGTGSDMVTYQGGTGLRLLNGAGFSGEYAGDLQTANANVKLTADRAASATNTNSLILNGFGLTDPGGSVTMPMASASLAGNILINSATNIAGANTTLGITTFELPILATASSTISAVIGTATTGSVTLSGTGNVTMSGTNLYTSTTFVNGATFTAGANDVLSSGGVTIVGGTYDLNGNSDSIGALSVNAGTVSTGAGTLTLGGTVTTIANNNVASFITGNLGLGANRDFNIGDGLMDNDVIISAVISGGFTLTKSTGSGVLMLSGNNTYSGATTVSAGILRLGATGDATNTPLGTTAAGTTVSGSTAFLDLYGYTLGTSEALTLSGAGAAGALQNTSSSAVDYDGLITLGAASTIIVNYGDINITNTGNITGNTFGLTLGGVGTGTLASNLNTTSGTLTKSGSGVWTISGASSTFTGLITISAGILKLGATGDATNTPFGTNAGGITITNGGTLDLNGFTLGTAEPIGALSGTGIASIGSLMNSSDNSISYSGAITLAATSRIVNHGSGVLTLSGNISGNFALTYVAVGGITQSSSSVHSGTSTITKEGSGTLILAGQNSISGAITVSTGVLQLGASGGATNTPLGTSAAGVTVSAGAVLDLSTYNLGGASTYETLNITGTGIKNGGALIANSSGTSNFGAMTVTTSARVTNSGSGAIAFTGTITAANGVNFGVGGSGPVNISGVYGATATTATLTKRDAGTLTISAASITTGLVRINSGTLKYGVANALSTPAVTVAGGSLDLNGFNETNIGAVTLIDGSIINGGGAATLTSTTTYTVENGTISAVLGGTSIALNKNTGGTVTLSAANTFTGTTSINAGTLAWGINDALSTGSLTVTGGIADLGTSTDTVATVTLTSGALTSSTGVLTGTSYAFTSGTASAILGGSIGLTKTTTGTVTLSGTNTYTGTTTITAGTLRATKSRALGDESATNTLVFNGGTLQAGGDISSPSSRSVTLTSTGLVDTNGYTITLAGTIGSASGITKNGLGTLTTNGAVTLGAALTVNTGTFNQASSLNMTSGAVTVASAGVWQNVGTGAVTLAGGVTNSGTITLNSNNGLQCVDGTDSILVRSSVNNTTRAWSGTGTFNMYNLDVDDMTGSGVTVYNSTLSGDTTWTVGTCASFSVAGTANGNNTATVKVAYNGSLQGQTGTIGSGTWSISGLDSPSLDDIVTVWIDGVTDSNESTGVTKWSSGNITSMVLNTNVLTIGSNQNTSLSVTNLGLCDVDTGCSDEDIMHTSNSGQLLLEASGNTYTAETLKVLASNTLTLNSGSSETITTEKLDNAGVITATGTPTITLTGTSGTLFTNTGTFTPASGSVVVSGNGDTLINSGVITFNNLTLSGTGAKTLGGNVTINSTLTVGTGSTFDPTSSYTVTGSGTNTLDVTGTIKVQHSTFAGSYSSFETRNLNSSSTVDYALNGDQTVDNTLTYDNLIVSGSSTGSWTQQTNSGSRTWYSIASSADGTKLVAGTNNGYIYTSTDSGVNWTEQTNSGTHTWYGVASSSDGTKLVAGASAGYIYTSTNSGANWTEQTNSGSRSWIGVASSSDGTKLVGIVNGGYIYTSTDSGANWTQQTSSGSRSWNSVASSSDGTKLVAGVDGGYIYTSTDSGANWTQQTSSGSRNWYSIASSSDGTKLAAINNSGYVYTSTDSGANWTAQTTSGLRNWWAIASSSDGAKLVAVVQDGYIYKSTDSGANWTEQTSLGVESWWSATSSTNGEKLAASVINSGYIHTYVGATTVTLGGSTTVNDVLTISSRNLDTSDYNISAGSVSVAGGIFTMGSSTVSLTDTGTVWSYSSGTVTADTSTIKLTNSSSALKTFSGNGATYNNFWFAPATGTGTLEILGSNTFADFKDDGTVAHSILFTAGTTTNLTSWTVSGNVGQLITINSGDGSGSTSTATHTLSDTTGVNESDYLNIQHSVAQGGAVWYAGANSTDNNSAATAGSGWLFTGAPRYWVGGTASWDGTAGSKWSNSSGGTGGASIPTSSTTVYFNASSGSGTVTIASGNTGVKDLIFTGFTGTLSGTAGITVSGGLTIGSSMTNNYTGDITFNATSGTKTITSNGKTFGSNIIINGSGAIFTPGDAFNTSGNLTVTAGTFALGANNVTIGGTTSITGTLNDASATGSNLFTGTVTVNNGGTWSNSNNPAYEFRGGLTVNSTSTFSSGSGTYTFSTNAQTISGTQSYTLTNLSNTITSGSGLTFSGSNPTVTTLTQGTNAVLTFSGTMPTISTLSASASGNTVVYGGGTTQTVIGTTYHHLTLNNGGTYTADNNITINGQMNVTSGTFDPTSSYTVTGSGTNTLDVTGTIKVQHSTFAGSYISFETFNLNSGSTVDYALNGTQTIDNTPIYYNLTTSGGGTKTLGGATTVANSGTVTVSAGTFDPSTYLLTGNGTNTLTVASGATLNVGASTFSGSYSAGFTTVTLSSGSTVNYSLNGTQTVDNSRTYYNLTTSGGGTKTLGGATVVTNTTTLTAGTLSTGNYTFSTSSVALSGGTFNLGSSTISLNGTGTVWNYSSGSVTAGTSTIKLTDTSATSKTFVGGGETYGNIWFAGEVGGGSYTLTGSNTFSHFRDSGTSAHTIYFTAGTNTTITSWDVSGSVGKLISLNSTTPLSTWTLTNTVSGYSVESDYLSIRDSIATGGAYFFAGGNSVNDTTGGSANTGWIFAMRTRGGGGGVESSANPDPQVGGGGVGGGSDSENSGNGDQTGGGSGTGGGGDVGFLDRKRILDFINKILLS